MSGEFRELNSRPYFSWEALAAIADAERGNHRISQAMQDMCKALAPVEEGAAWFEAGDSSEASPVLALVQNWPAIEAAHKRLDTLRKEYSAVMEAALREGKKSIGTFMAHEVTVPANTPREVIDEMLKRLRA